MPIGATCAPGRRRRPALVCAALSLALVAASALGGCGAGAQGGGGGGEAGLATVVRVVDGDTLVVRLRGGEDQRVRLLGIDTPESVKPDTPVECFGTEAARRTAELLPPGTDVRLVGDVEATDAYGRLLAYVYRASDTLFVNLALVDEGFAQPYTYPPNVAHADELVRAGRDARQAGRGLWASCPSARTGTDRP